MIYKWQIKNKTKYDVLFRRGFYRDKVLLLHRRAWVSNSGYRTWRSSWRCVTQTRVGALLVAPDKGRTTAGWWQTFRRSLRRGGRRSLLPSPVTPSSADTICRRYARLALECAGALPEQQASRQRSSAFTNVCCVTPKGTRTKPCCDRRARGLHKHRPLLWK